MIIHVHESQHPQRVMEDLRNSLRDRAVNHKFHYDSIRQTQRWLELHQALSPARQDPGCAATYTAAFADAAARLPLESVDLIGLGCGGGHKDCQLAGELIARGRQVRYLAVDVSSAMVITACQEVARSLAIAVLPPVVCDLARVPNLAAALNPSLQTTSTSAVRLFTFFNMIPNFEPETILPLLAGGIGERDWLLFSANLAPGPDYESGVREILPLYDNDLTREWLRQFLLDLGVAKEDGAIEFSIERDSDALGLLRVTARFFFKRSVALRIGNDSFPFHAGDGIRLFFSYRLTPELIRQLLERYGLIVQESWITPKGDEGVFLVRRVSH